MIIMVPACGGPVVKNLTIVASSMQVLAKNDQGLMLRSPNGVAPVSIHSWFLILMLRRACGGGGGEVELCKSENKIMDIFP